MRFPLAIICVAGLIAWGAGCTRGHRTGTRPRARPAATQKAGSPQADTVWVRAEKETYKTQQELEQQRSRELEKGLHYDVLWRGNPNLPTVALTFDDGPHPDFTPAILAILERYNVKATFFVVGKMVERAPALVAAERKAGHLIGNHTYHHVNLTNIPIQEAVIEWQACQDAVKSITGESMHYCRPPGGDYNHDVILAAQDLALTTVLWTDDPGDYASPGDKVIETRLLDSIGNGGIILIHDGVQQTIDVLPQIIERLRVRGFRFVTAAEMNQEFKSKAAQGTAVAGYHSSGSAASRIAPKTGPSADAAVAQVRRSPARTVSHPQEDPLAVHPEKD